MSRPLRALLLGVFAVSAMAVSPPPVWAEPADQVVYTPPVDAPISDPFRPPPHPFGPGNRGIEYATEPGTPVRAVAAGEVTFAGQVAGALHVTVIHADGLRSTASYLATVGVQRGETVGGGQTLGTAGRRTHLGVRAGNDYLDPASLFTRPTGRVRLVPTRGVPSPSVAAERAAIAAWMAERRSGFTEGADWLRSRAVGAADLANTLAGALDPTGFTIGTGIELFDRLADRSPCTSPGHAVERPSGRRIVVLVGGLGSTSGDAAVDGVDVAALGYDAGDVYRFSYAGGRVPDRADRRQALPASRYGAAESQADLTVSGKRLGDLVAGLAELEPGVPIDIVAHSQGGLVARLAIEGLDAAGDSGVLGAVVTIGTPHQGADLAVAAAAVHNDRAAARLFEVVDSAMGGGLDLEAPSIGQLAVGSTLTDELERVGVPDGVALTSIGARGDLVVAATRTQVDGASNVTLPLAGAGAHDALPADVATTREIGLAIGGLPPTCESNRDRVLDVVGGRLVVQTEQLLAAGITVGTNVIPD